MSSKKQKQSSQLDKELCKLEAKMGKKPASKRKLFTKITLFWNREASVQ